MKNLIITHGPSGHPLLRPITLEVKENETPAEEKLRQYITDTFTSRTPNLIPFVFRHISTRELAKHYLFHKSGSQKTLHNAVYYVQKFCDWLNTSPDVLVRGCIDKDGFTKPKAVAEIRHKLDDFLLHLKATRDLSNGSLREYVTYLKALLRLNDVNFELPYVIHDYHLHEARAASREEIQKVLDIANLRERVVVLILATAGLRPGTLSKLKYRHVKHDLEHNIIPTQVTVETEITKGKYGSYYTFLNQETVDHLNSYLSIRRIGVNQNPPEDIQDESPLIISARTRKSKTQPISTNTIQKLVRSLYRRAGLIDSTKKMRRYELQAYSFRRFFQTELASRGAPHDCVDFMMGHTVNRYNDIKMKGVDYLRGVYLTAGLTIRPKVRLNKIDALKEIISSWGLDPQKILAHEVLSDSSPTGAVRSCRIGEE